MHALAVNKPMVSAPGTQVEDGVSGEPDDLAGDVNVA
jgi:hypothetical protein